MGNRLYWKLAWQNLKNHRQVYLPYFLSSVGIIMMFYIIFSLGDSFAASDVYGRRTTAVMMNLGAIVIGVFAVLFLFYTNSFMMKRRKKELGLYNILGMEKWHIARVVFRETLLTAGGTIALGLGAGIVFSRAMFLVMDKILQTESHIPFMVSLPAVIATVILFLAVFFLTACYNLLQVKLSKPIELLHGGEIGEKEPKAHWLLAVLGAVLLGGGYYLAVTIQNPVDALVMFFVAVILVILGTYLLFITGVTALLKLLKKNKKFYYQANHFTTVSGMLYRMKQNAAGLASICILFTCLLVTVSTTFSLYTGTETTLRARYPRNILVDGENVSVEAKNLVREIVAKECEQRGVSPKNLWERNSRQCVLSRNGREFSARETVSNTYAMFEIYTQDEYRRFSGQDLQLNKDEVLLCDPRNTYHEDEVVFCGENGNVTYRVTRPEQDFSSGSGVAMLYETYYLVIPDESLFETLLYGVESGDIQTALNPENWAYYFDVDLPGQEVIDLSNDIEAALFNRQDSQGREEGVTYERMSVTDAYTNREDVYALYGGLFFLGLFLGTLFLLGTALIIYYKQVSEGYEDVKRFAIMQQVGMSRQEVKRSIHSQVLQVFFLPLLMAVLHLGFAFPMLQKILLLLSVADFQLILGSAIGCVLVFGLVYGVIYAVTARTYYKIVETAAE